ERFRELRSTLRPGHVLMVVDFQERLSVKEQDEVQSQHWDNQCTTIFPAVVYLNLKGRVWAFSFQVLSDDMAQDNAWVQHVMSGLLNERIPDSLRKIGAAPMTNATLFTDNCAKQFKCLFQFNWRFVHVEHHFFGSGHGKNVSDSEGGVTKTWVRQMVKNMTWRIEKSNDL
ncbi:unnamed protein product, partial [Ectocarpus sp. 12 AP-2014]